MLKCKSYLYLLVWIHKNSMAARASWIESNAVYAQAPQGIPPGSQVQSQGGVHRRDRRLAISCTVDSAWTFIYRAGSSSARAHAARATPRCRKGSTGHGPHTSSCREEGRRWRPTQTDCRRGRGAHWTRSVLALACVSARNKGRPCARVSRRLHGQAGPHDGRHKGWKNGAAPAAGPRRQADNGCQPPSCAAGGSIKVTKV